MEQHSLVIIIIQAKCHSVRPDPIFQNAAPRMEARNNAILEILGLGGNEEARKLWKKIKGYHRRSLGENS